MVTNMDGEESESDKETAGSPLVPKRGNPVDGALMGHDAAASHPSLPNRTLSDACRESHISNSRPDVPHLTLDTLSHTSSPPPHIPFPIREASRGGDDDDGQSQHLNPVRLSLNIWSLTWMTRSPSRIRRLLALLWCQRGGTLLTEL